MPVQVEENINNISDFITVCKNFDGKIAEIDKFVSCVFDENYENFIKLSNMVKNSKVKNVSIHNLDMDKSLSLTKHDDKLFASIDTYVILRDRGPLHIPKKIDDIDTNLRISDRMLDLIKEEKINKDTNIEQWFNRNIDKIMKIRNKWEKKV